MYSHTCACTSLCVKHVSLVVSLSASTHNTLTQPNLPLLPVSSVGLLLGAMGSVSTETAPKQTKGWNGA